MNSVQITTASTPEQVDFARSAWDQLLPSDKPRSVFVDPDRILALSDSLGRKPHVISFHSGNRPIALLVAESGLRRTAFRIGYKHVRSPLLRVLDIHYGGVLTDGSQLGESSLARELIRLSSSRDIDLISFNHLPVDHPLFMSLTSHPAIRRRMTVFDSEPHHWLQLAPGSVENTMNIFSRKHRYNLRRADRMLNEHVGGNLALRIFTTDEEVDTFIKGAANIVAKSYQGALGVGFRDSEVWRKLLATEAALGRLRSYWLTVEGIPIAFHAGVVHGTSYALEATAYLPEYSQWSPGTVLLLRVIEDLCMAGVKDIDYGFGEADYKRNHSTITCEESTIHIHSAGSRYHWMAPLERTSVFVEKSMKRFVGRLGLKARIRKYWRNRITTRQIPRSLDRNRESAGAGIGSDRSTESSLRV
jgi:CelD/BcsL family acetyltransferase involved in cellulose biosynthesis